MPFGTLEQVPQIVKFASLVSRRALSSCIGFDRVHYESVIHDNSDPWFGVTDTIEASVRTVWRLIQGVRREWIFVKETSLEDAIRISARLLCLVCIDVKRNGLEGFFGAFLSGSEYRGRHYIDVNEGEDGNSQGVKSNGGDQEDSGENVSSSETSEAGGDIGEDEISEGDEHNLRNFIGDSNDDDEEHMANVTEPNPRSLDQRGLSKDALGQAAGRRRPCQKSVQRPYHRRFGIFQRSWADRKAKRGLQEPYDQRERKHQGRSTHNPKRPKLTHCSMFEDKEHNDMDRFNDSTAANNSHSEAGSVIFIAEQSKPVAKQNTQTAHQNSLRVADSSLPSMTEKANDPRTASRSPPPSSGNENALIQYWKNKAVAAQEGEAAALLQLQAIKARVEDAEGMRRAAHDTEHKLQQEIKEATVARKAAEEEAEAARKEMTEMRGKQEKLDKALRDAGYSLSG